MRNEEGDIFTSSMCVCVRTRCSGANAHVFKNSTIDLSGNIAVAI